MLQSSRLDRRLFVFLLCGGWWSGLTSAQTNLAPSFPHTARIGDLVFFTGTPIDEITLPAATGGDIDPDSNNGQLSDYSFDPAKLPPGLHFDRFTRVLSGVPKYALRKKTYRLWVHDDDDDWNTNDADSLKFSIEIADKQAQDAARQIDNQAAAAAANEFAASFESAFQWFQKSNLPRLSGVTTWNSAVWMGERIQKQILVTGVAARDRVSVVASDFRSRDDMIPASAVTFRYPQFVIGDIEARDCDGYPERDEIVYLSDALFPEQPRKRARRYPVMVWMSVDIPEDARPGRYAGNVGISARSGEQIILDITLEVTPWQMPPVSERRFHLDLWQFPVSVLDRYNDANPGKRIKIWSEEHYALLEPTYRYLAELGQRTVTAYIKEGAFAAPSMIRWVALEGGKRWRYDYSIFDAHVERLAEWGIDAQINAFSPVGWNKNEIPFWDEASGEDKVFKVEVGSKTYNVLWNAFLTDFKRHLLEKGWFEKTVLYMDEVPREEMEAIIGLIRFNDEDWKIGLSYGHDPGERVIASLYDVSGYYESETAVQTYAEQLTTFYTSCTLRRPNNYVAADANPVDMAAMPWYTMFRGHDGYLRWAFDNWKSHDPLDLRDGVFTAGDYSFVYRSSNDKGMTMIPSVRSELLRDGIEDYEKVQVLRETMRRCGKQELQAELQEVINSFSTERLMAGQAKELIIRARAHLHEISQSVSPGLC